MGLRALRAAVALHHAGATAESLDYLAVPASRQERWYDAAVILAAGEGLRAGTGIRRFAVTSHLVTEAEARTARRLEPADLVRARAPGAVVDALTPAPDLPSGERPTD